MTAKFVARDTETLTASATETVVMVKAAASKRLHVVEYGVSFNDVDAADPAVLVHLIRLTTDGTSTALTIVEEDTTTGESPLASAAKDFTAEPTAGAILRSHYVTPAAGLIAVQFPLGDEIVVPVSGRIGIQCVTAAGVTPSVAAYIAFRE
jgi:hypothetical protein